MVLVKTLIALFLVALAANAVNAEPYPDRPIRIVAGNAAGTGVDIAARILADRLSSELGKRVYVEDRPGAGGNVAAEYVAREKPDGYTLLFTNNAYTINPIIFRDLSYDPEKDFIPISLVGTSPMLLVAAPDLPISTPADLIKLAKSEPGKINLASPGVGSPSYLAGVLFKKMAGIDLPHVPYKGAPEALADLMADRVQLYISGLPPVLPLAAAGKVKAIAVTTANRSSAAPNIPTIAEGGLPGYDVTLWYGLFAPNGVSDPVIAALNSAVIKAMAAADIREKFSVQGVDATSDTSAEFMKLIRAESNKWRNLLRSEGIKPE